jgi:hypothetical protein
MELICEDFYFYNNGIYKTISNLCPDGFFADLKKVEPSIRIFGTREQIDKALDTYIELTGLNLDECYDFKIEEKGSFFYNEENEKIKKRKLKEYKEQYNKLNNNAALITTI